MCIVRQWDGIVRLAVCGNPCVSGIHSMTSGAASKNSFRHQTDYVVNPMGMLWRLEFDLRSVNRVDNTGSISTSPNMSPQYFSKVLSN